MFRILVLGIVLLGFCTIGSPQESQQKKGIYLFQEGKYAEAAEVLRNVSEAEKELAATWIYLVFSHLKLGNQTAANEAFETFQRSRIKPSLEPTKVYDTPCRMISRPPPRFTEEARSAAIQGEVTLWIEFQADGEVGSIFTKQALSHGLTESAIMAARRIRFEPAIRNGKPVSVVLVFSYGFQHD